MKTNVSRAMSDLRRAGSIGTLLLALMLMVAACGTDTTPTQTPAAAQPTATTVSMEPAATATGATTTEATETPMNMDAGAMTATTAPTVATEPTATTAAVVEPTAEATVPAAESEVVEVQATLKEWGLELSQTDVAAGTVRFVVSNGGRLPHNFAIRIDGGDQLARTQNFSPSDGAQVVEVELAPGTYVVYCALPGHEQQGQRNVIVVS